MTMEITICFSNYERAFKLKSESSRTGLLSDIITDKCFQTKTQAKSALETGTSMKKWPLQQP
jgi:hypothetical protein